VSFSIPPFVHPKNRGAKFIRILLPWVKKSTALLLFFLPLLKLGLAGGIFADVFEEKRKGPEHSIWPGGSIVALFIC